MKFRWFRLARSMHIWHLNPERAAKFLIKSQSRTAAVLEAQRACLGFTDGQLSKKDWLAVSLGNQQSWNEGISSSSSQNYLCILREPVSSYTQRPEIPRKSFHINFIDLTLWRFCRQGRGWVGRWGGYKGSRRQIWTHGSPCSISSHTSEWCAPENFNFRYLNREMCKLEDHCWNCAYILIKGEETMLSGAP